jgi:hypothetical protein
MTRRMWSGTESRTVVSKLKQVREMQPAREPEYTSRRGVTPCLAQVSDRISVVNRAGDEDRGKPLSETARENGRLDGDEGRERSISRSC